MKKILVLNFFPAFTPPTSGGELRFLYMYTNLSNFFDVTLLTPTYNGGDVTLIKHSDTFKEYRIPKEDIHNEIHWKLEQEKFSPEFSALTCAYSAEKLNQYHNYYLKLYPNADIIIHEFPYMLNYDMFFGFDNKLRIYNSHNVEYDLLRQIYSEDTGKKHLDYIFELEKKLVLNADILFSISNNEKTRFEELYGINHKNIKLAPNGINPQDFLKRDEKIQRKTAFFIGSGHPPNRQAVEFIINEIAPNCPDITFLIAGTCCSGFSTDKTNVKLLGKVSEEEKNSLFKTSDIAINPMFSGAGTNLKTLEFLSMGIPMISTKVGVRGIELEDSKHFLLASKEDFPDKINALINDNVLKKSLSKLSKPYINENFNWKNIAESIAKEIKKRDKKPSKTLLLLNDFEVSSPFGGGQIRINKLYAELSKTYNVVLLCLNNTNNIKKTWITDNFLEISFPKTLEHLKEESKINSKYWVSATDIVNSYMISKNELYMNAAKSLASDFDATVLSHPYMYEAIEGLQCKYLIHESLNHELLLKKELLLSHPLADRLIKQTQKVESNSCIKSDFLISVSDADHAGLRGYCRKNKEIITIQNGVGIVQDELFEKEFTDVKAMFQSYTVVLFIGSAHIPNIESAKYILETLSSQLKSCYFVMIGSVCDVIMSENIPSNVLLFGKLDNDYKNVLFSIADIAINPMFGGSGSNLKLAEYFAWKLPTVTTTFGMRGYTIEDGKEALICDISMFPNNIVKLAENKVLSKNLGQNAFQYVQSNVVWTILGKRYRNLLDHKIFGIQRKKLLIITYRFTTPPLGGAEVYMYELIKGLDELGDFDITVAYLDAYDIENQYHFSIKASHNTKIPQNKFKHVTFKAFKFNELSNEEKLNNSKILMKNWTKEFLNSARKFVKYYNQSILLGGWNFPEKIATSSQIWSSSTSEIYLKETNSIRIQGFSPSKKLLSLKMNHIIIYEKKVNGTFYITVTIPNDGILTFECIEEYHGDDVRALGVLIESIVSNYCELDLSYSYRDFLKNNYLTQYIEELIFIATQRDEKLDSIFQETRGLNSNGLEEYLDENTKNFDVLLGHSIPFSTTITTSKYAMKYNIPYALLPHFHFDDEFYHWKSYYNAFEHASMVFSFPTVSIDKFYNKLNIDTLEVPGGGLNKQEYNHIDSKLFLELYASDKPYFFVLGRKSGAKNYASVIDAIEKVNKKEHLCNLVMIGRDEDGVEINSKYTYYLGEQSREIVLGALQECYGLITMSESESFGIVIVEAWMLKKPVIVNAKCPAFLELVEDEINGLYADKDNLQSKIKYLLDNTKNSILLGKNGKKIIDNYTWKDIGKRFNNKLLNFANPTSKCTT